MVEYYTTSRRARRHGRANELTLFQRKDARAHDSGVRGPDGDPDDEDFEVDVVAKNRHYHHEEEERRDHEDDFKRTGKELVDPASVVSGEETQRGTQRKGEGGGQDPKQEGHPGTPDDTAQQVPPEFIGPEDMSSRGCGELGEFNRGWGVGGENFGNQRRYR